MPQLCSEMTEIDDVTVGKPVATKGVTPRGRPAVTADAAEAKIMSTVRALLGVAIDKHSSLVDAGVDSLGTAPPRLFKRWTEDDPRLCFVHCSRAVLFVH